MMFRSCQIRWSLNYKVDRVRCDLSNQYPTRVKEVKNNSHLLLNDVTFDQPLKCMSAATGSLNKHTKLVQAFNPVAGAEGSRIWKDRVLDRKRVRTKLQLGMYDNGRQAVTADPDVLAVCTALVNRSLGSILFWERHRMTQVQALHRALCLSWHS